MYNISHSLFKEKIKIFTLKVENVLYNKKYFFYSYLNFRTRWDKIKKVDKSSFTINRFYF